MSETQANLAASVRQRLLNLARGQGEDFQLVLTRYVAERLLYRLCQSSLSNEFILKGATLFAVWAAETAMVSLRPTRDLDFWQAGNPTVTETLEAFREIVSTSVEPDGLQFHTDTITGELVREGERYEGCRLRLPVTLGMARISLQIDVGFGDVITKNVLECEFPTLLPFPAPHLRIYPRETVIAEIFEAMVSLGQSNTRLKDFFDMWTLSERFEFEGQALSRAIFAAFAHRGTPLPTVVPPAFRVEFVTDVNKVKAWQAFLRRHDLQAPDLSAIADQITRFLMPPVLAAVSRIPFGADWQPGGDWLLPGPTAC